MAGMIILLFFSNSLSTEIIEELLVFDRWGVLVFEGQNLRLNEPQDGWDGTFKDQEVPSGVYTYLAKVRFIDGVSTRYSGKFNNSSLGDGEGGITYLSNSLPSDYKVTTELFNTDEKDEDFHCYSCF